MTAPQCDRDSVDVGALTADQMGDVGKAVDEMLLRQRARALVRALHRAAADTEPRRARN